MSQSRVWLGWIGCSPPQRIRWQKWPIAGPRRLQRMEESTSGSLAPFLGYPARRIGPFGLRRGAARARQPIFDAPACSRLAISIIPTAAYVALIGGAALIEDRCEIRRRWLE